MRKKLFLLVITITILEIAKAQENQLIEQINDKVSIDNKDNLSKFINLQSENELLNLAQKKHYNKNKNKPIYFYSLYKYYIDIEKDSLIAYRLLELAKQYLCWCKNKHVIYAIENDGRQIEKGRKLIKSEREKLCNTLFVRDILGLYFLNCQNKNIPTSLEVCLIKEDLFDKCLDLINKEISIKGNLLSNLTIKGMMYEYFLLDKDSALSFYKEAEDNYSDYLFSKDKFIFDFIFGAERLHAKIDSLEFKFKVNNNQYLEKKVPNKHKSEESIKLKQDELVRFTDEYNNLQYKIKNDILIKNHQIEIDSIRLPYLDLKFSRPKLNTEDLLVEFNYTNSGPNTYFFPEIGYIVKNIINVCDSFVACNHIEDSVKSIISSTIDYNNCPNLFHNYNGEFGNFIYDEEYYLIQDDGFGNEKSSMKFSIQKGDYLTDNEYAFLTLFGLNHEILKRKNEFKRLNFTFDYNVKLRKNDELANEFSEVVTIKFENIFQPQLNNLKKLIDDYELKIK